MSRDRRCQVSRSDVGDVVVREIKHDDACIRLFRTKLMSTTFSTHKRQTFKQSASAIATRSSIPHEAANTQVMRCAATSKNEQAYDMTHCCVASRSPAVAKAGQYRDHRKLA
jgi:hypothetical protein